MQVEIVVTVLLILLLALMIGVPVAYALGLSGGIGLLWLRGTDAASAAMGSLPFTATAKYSWIVVPLFIFMGVVAAHGRIGEDLYALLARMLRRVPGNLGIATVGACAGFSAVSGSSLATATTVGRISLDQMRRHGYPPSMAAGIVAYAGTLGVLIPPSIIIVVYGLMSGESIGAMLVAGIIPGILSAVAYMVYIMVRSARGVRVGTGQLATVGAGAPAAPRAARPGPALHGRLSEQLRSAVLVTCIFLVVMGGVYGGVFTVTEAAAIGALVSLVAVPFHLWSHSRGREHPLRKTMWLAARESASTTAMVFAVVVGASIFTMFLVMARVPSTFATWIAGMDLPPLAILLLILASTIPLGMFLDAYSMMLIVVPIAYPAVTDAGISGILFGILMVKMVEVAFVTPPLGLNCYVVAGVAKDISVEQVFRGVVPFLLVDFVVIGLLIAFPAITLWLPGLMAG